MFLSAIEENWQQTECLLRTGAKVVAPSKRANPAQHWQMSVNRAAQRMTNSNNLGRFSNAVTARIPGIASCGENSNINRAKVHSEVNGCFSCLCMYLQVAKASFFTVTPDFCSQFTHPTPITKHQYKQNTPTTCYCTCHPAWDSTLRNSHA